MMCRVFYHLSALAEEVSSSRPVDLPSSRLWQDLVAWLQDEEDYIGLVDPADNVLQIMLDAGSNAYWVELPVADERMSYGQRLSGDELKELLERLPARFLRASFPRFAPRPWPSAH